MQTIGKFLEMRQVARLKPFAKNARTHSQEQVAQLAAAIREFGFTAPILISPDGEIRAGHGRLEAAKSLGMTEVPTLVVGSDWTPEQVRAYVIADNKLALNAGWDEVILRFELAELQALDFDLSLMGFGDLELASLLEIGREGIADPDEVPAVEENVVSSLGDVWLLGSHRLVCGDSTDANTVAKALNGAAPHLMVTDPPYGVNYDADWRNKAARTCEGMGNRAFGAGAIGKVLNDDRADWREAWALFPGDVAYVWHAGLHAASVDESLRASGFGIRSQIIWAKQQFAIGRGDYHWQHEPCWYAVRKGRKGHYDGGRKQSTLWEIDKPQKSETGHSTQKSVECMKRPIENNSSQGQAIYEPFSGSGTTIIAGEMTGRVIHAVELNPAYVDVAVRRWQDFTGFNATLEENGKTFTEVSAERSGK